ncbi:MAG: FxsA family protein [Marinagarivorans sp.]|nr:FxsA family protein [Marinagarivorans sp.]
MRFLVVFLVLVPVLDLALMGHFMGFLNTLLWVVGSALLGCLLIRNQGLNALQEAQQKTARGELPITEVTSGLFSGLAGLLLIHPGLITDLMGLVCLVPWLRSGLVLWFSNSIFRSMTMRGFKEGMPNSNGFRASNDDNVIEGEFQSMDDSANNKDAVRKAIIFEHYTPKATDTIDDLKK